MPKSERRLAIRHHRPPRVPRTYKRLDADLTERAEVTVVLRSKGSSEQWNNLVAESSRGLPGQRTYLTRAEFGKAWGASPEDLAQVSAFGRRYKLKTIQSDAWRRCVVLSGTLERLQEAFGVEFQRLESPLGRFRSNRTTPTLPASIHPIVEAVLGLDNLPSARPRIVTRTGGSTSELNLRELASLYEFPTRFGGKGQCVAVIELGGGIHKKDYNDYFRQIGLAAPPLRVKTIGKAANRPASTKEIRKALEEMRNGTFPWNDPTQTDVLVQWTCETAMDVEVVGTLAPETTILLVFTEGTDQGQYHALTSVLADTRLAPSVISCSWSFVEDPRKRGFMSTLDRWFQAAAVLGVTVCFASGDSGDGTLDQTGPLTFVTDFPASCPYVLACGGTTLNASTGAEVAWRQTAPGGVTMAGGGGFSEVFAPPAWQISAGINAANWIPPCDESGMGRGVPDVSAKADLVTEFCYLVGGMKAPAGGTSLSTPIWGALMAVLNQALRNSVGLISPLLYTGGLQNALRDITQGNIGHLYAKVGWDPCTGWGSPHGEAMLAALSGEKAVTPKDERAGPRHKRRA